MRACVPASFLLVALASLTLCHIHPILQKCKKKIKSVSCSSDHLLSPLQIIPKKAKKKPLLLRGRPNMAVIPIHFLVKDLFSRAPASASDSDSFSYSQCL